MNLIVVSGRARLADRKYCVVTCVGRRAPYCAISPLFLLSLSRCRSRLSTVINGYQVHTPQARLAGSPPGAIATSEHQRSNRPYNMSSSPDSSASSIASSSATSSPTLKPTMSRSSPTPPLTALPRSSRFSSTPAITPIPEDEPLQTLNDYGFPDLANDHKALEASNDLKSCLMELLNSDAVRSDSKMRAWVQTRLMDAELELKRQRRRKRSLPPREVAVATEAA